MCRDERGGANISPEGENVEWMWSGCGVDVDNLTGDDIAPEGGELSLIGLGCGVDVEWMWTT